MSQETKLNPATIKKLHASNVDKLNELVSKADQGYAQFGRAVYRQEYEKMQLLEQLEKLDQAYTAEVTKAAIAVGIDPDSADAKEWSFDREHDQFVKGTKPNV